MGELQPTGGIIQSIQQAGRLDVPPSLPLREAHPSQEVMGVDERTILGPMEQRKGRSLGVWRQTLWEIPSEVLVVQDRATHTGARPVIPGRPGITGLLVGKAKGECETP